MQIIKADEADGIELAAKRIAAGEVVAIPTDTVYGLVCAAHSREAVRQVYEIKGRNEDKPLVLFVSGVDQANEYGHLSEEVEGLMRRLWPGLGGEGFDGGFDLGFGEVVDEGAGAEGGGEDEFDFAGGDFFVLLHGLVEVVGGWRVGESGGEVEGLEQVDDALGVCLGEQVALDG